MSELSDAAAKITEAAARSEVTTEFFDSVTTLGVDEYVTNTNNGLTVPSVQTQINDLYNENATEITAAVEASETARDESVAAKDETQAIKDSLASLDSVADIPNITGYAVGDKITWLGYYSVSDGGSNWGIVKQGAHTADGGKIFTITGDYYVEANFGTWRVSMKKFGVIGNGVADDTVQTKSALAQALSTNSTLFVPQGVHLISETLEVSEGIEIKGEHWVSTSNRNTTGENERGLGSFFYRNGFLGNLFSLTATNSVTFKNIAFDEEHMSAGADFVPTEYSWNIFSEITSDLKLTNILMFKARKGIRVENQGGRFTIKGMWGQNLGTFVDIDFSADINRINNLHIWPFWSEQVDMRAWTRENCVGILTGRNDNPFWSNVFTIDQKYGIRFKLSESATATNKVTNKLHLTNGDFDQGTNGIYVDSDVVGATAQFSNVSIQTWPDTESPSRGVFILGSNNRFDFTNLRTTTTAKESININGTGNKVRVTSLECHTWGTDSTDAAIFVESGNSFESSDRIRYLSVNSATRWLTGSEATVTLPSGGCYYKARISTSQVTDEGTITQLIWDTEALSSGDFSLQSSGQITCLDPGVYKVNMSLYLGDGVTSGESVLGRISAVTTGDINVTSTKAVSTGDTLIVSGLIKVGARTNIGSMVRINSASTGETATILAEDQRTYIEITRA